MAESISRASLFTESYSEEANASSNEAMALDLPFDFNCSIATSAIDSSEDIS
jgi:hypothetical protein